jgi:hypothetical protein
MKKPLMRRKKWYFVRRENSISLRERRPWRIESQSRRKGRRALKPIKANDGREFCTNTRRRALQSYAFSLQIPITMVSRSLLVDNPSNPRSRLFDRIIAQ